ncbi:MAG: EscU/YscU/HrcU family type III secretion system export apparatus switch protein [Alphaproteobacteria bacterium]
MADESQGRAGTEDPESGEAGSGGRPRAIAVALRHDPEISGQPRVVASGRGLLAEQILEIAFANGVRVREDADLAQLLAAVDIDSDIPVEAYVAVAEILAYLYKANGAAGGGP